MLFAVFVSAFLLAAPVAAQDSTQESAPKPASAKGKKSAPPAATGEAATGEESPAKAEDAEKTQPGKKDDADKKEDTKADGTNKEDAKKDEAKKEEAPPVVESPKLIEVPQGETTSTARPKIVAVFIFTNGNRIESDDYLITKDAVFINKNGQKTRYPMNTVDREATKSANQARGVDIVFPKSKSEFNLDF